MIFIVLDHKYFWHDSCNY